MPIYTYAPAPVLVESTGEFAIGATGVLRPSAGAEPVPIWDLNDSPLSGILVGPFGAHQAFKADIPDGVGDFGSTLVVAVSVESIRSGLTATAVAESALSQAETLQTSKAAIIHAHVADDISDFDAAVLAVPGVGEGGGGVGIVDGGTPSSTFSDVYLDGGTPAGGGGLRLVSDLLEGTP